MPEVGEGNNFKSCFVGKDKTKEETKPHPFEMPSIIKSSFWSFTH